jgi:hypothetical protein
VVDVLFDEMDRQSLHSIVKKLEGRFVLFFVENDGLYASSDQFGKLDIYVNLTDQNTIILDIFVNLIYLNTSILFILINLSYVKTSILDIFVNYQCN